MKTQQKQQQKIKNSHTNNFRGGGGGEVKLHPPNNAEPTKSIKIHKKKIHKLPENMTRTPLKLLKTKRRGGGGGGEDKYTKTVEKMEEGKNNHQNQTNKVLR